MRLRGHGACFAVLSLALSVAAHAADPVPDVPEGWSYELWNELMSPYCPGRTLSECPSGQADQLRMWILMQEAAGRERADVEAELYERFGDEILPAPRASGFGIAAYAIPVVAFLAGGVLVAIFLRRGGGGGGPPAPPPAAPAALDPELERAIDEELSR